MRGGGRLEYLGLFCVKKLAKLAPLIIIKELNIQIHFFTCRLVYFLTVHFDNVQDGVLQANPEHCRTP
jgi:hypothetical protein